MPNNLPTSPTNEKAKHFFEPTVGKFVLLITLSIFFGWIVRWQMPIAESDKLVGREGFDFWIGFPFPYLMLHISANLPPYSSIALIGNLAFW